MRGCGSVACVLLALVVGSPASAGSPAANETGTLRVLRGALLEAGDLSAPFADPGKRVGRFVLRSAERQDLRVDPHLARLHVRGGSVWGRAAEPSADVDGLLELCRLGLAPFECAALPLRPAPEPPGTLGIYFPFVLLSRELTDQETALFGCGPFYGTECSGLLGPSPYPGTAGQGRFGRRDFVWVGTDPDGEWAYSRNVDPLTGRPRPLLAGKETFRSELEVISWNALMALVALSQQPGEPSDETLDPDQPFRTDGCSFAAPHLCMGIGGFHDDLASWRLSELPGDPRGGEAERWLWESAIAYDLVHARGSLAGFRDGRLYVFGPFVSPFEGARTGIGLLLVPPPGTTPDTSSPLVRVVPGPDGALGTGDDAVVGLAWGAAWNGFDRVSRPRERGKAIGQRRFGPPAGPDPP